MASRELAADPHTQAGFDPGQDLTGKLCFSRKCGFAHRQHFDRSDRCQCVGLGRTGDQSSGDGEKKNWGATNHGANLKVIYIND